ncbi:hypothetical protein GCM10027519_34500 [Kineococcus endophyticus]
MNDMLGVPIRHRHRDRRNMVKHGRFRALVVLGGLVATFSISTAAPATAEPSPCAGKWGRDVGSANFVGKDKQFSRWNANWWNCSGPGTDYVRAYLQNGDDSPCISVRPGEGGVPYGSSGSVWWTTVDGRWPAKFEKWVRC